MRAALNRRWPEDTLPRLGALAGTAVLLALAGRLLVGPPQTLRPASQGPRVQLVLVERAPPPGVAQVPSRGTVTRPAPFPGTVARPLPSRPRPPAPARAAAVAPRDPATAARAPLVLYDADGRVRVPGAAPDRWTAAPAAPPGAAVDRAASAGLQRPNPIPPRETRFARDWVSDGDVAEVSAQEIARAQRKIARFLFGRDIEHAKARPSPEVRFNPARHERSADVGSAATGDAYKAAPINYQPAPGLDGEASRRIREQVAALETSYAHCDRVRLQRVMQPLLAHLDELQKAEAAHARGADPVRARHLLPNAANGAYDMARRALWYADSQMAGCGG